MSLIKKGVVMAKKENNNMDYVFVGIKMPKELALLLNKDADNIKWYPEPEK